MTQRDFADAMGISYDQYKRLEKRGSLLGFTVEPAIVEDLTEVEQCVVLRRRYSMTITQLGDALQVSRTWVNLMERGLRPAHTLIAYWKQRDS